MIVNCPACGTPASIDANFYGKKLRCANQSCRQTFRVQSDGSVQMDMGRPDAAPRTYDWQNPPPSQEAQEGDWLSAPPPAPGQMPMASVVQPPMASVMPYGQAGTPMASVVSTGSDNDDSSYTPGDYGYGKKKNKFLIILIGLVILLLASGAFGYWLIQQNANQAILALKKNILESVDKKRWDEAISAGSKYREKIKDAGDKEIEFALDWSDLQQKLLPAQTSTKEDLRRGIDAVQQFYRNRRSDNNYPKYRKDFAESAFQLVKRGAEFIEKNPDPAVHADLKPLLDTANEIGKGVGDQDQVKVWASEAQKKLDASMTTISANLAKKNWIVRLDDVLAKENLGQIDAVQTEFQDLVKKHPSLLNDNDLNTKLNNLKQVEPVWVKYSVSNSASTTNKPSFGPSIRICPPVKSADGAQDDSGIVLAMARGTLYGLSAKTGKDRWALRVGQDVRELPPRITLGGEVPDVAFVVTTEDAGQTYLSQMNLVSGERTWTRRLASPCPAGAVLISNNRLVVPLKETVAIVEAGSGKMTGFFTIAGYEISSQPAHDKVRDRLFVPVDRGRIFVLDLASRKCVGVIYTDHGSGQIKGAPLVIDDLLVVCIATGSGAGSTRIRAYDISAKGANPNFEPPIGIYDMPGHASTSPYLDGSETLGIVSDQGLLWLFGVGKSSAVGTSQAKGNTPFYPLTSAPMPLKIKANSELKKDQPRPRVQVAHVALRDWWVFTHDNLVRNVFDPFRGIMNPSPVGSLPLGSPLHRAEVSPDARLVVVVTQPRGQAQMLASGIDRTTGKIVWQTQLGTEATQDPVSMADAVAMLDRGGAIFAVKASDVSANAGWQVCGTWPALPLVAASHRLLKTPNGETLISLSYDPVRARIIIRRIDGSGMSTSVTREFPHTSAPAGTPVAIDDGTTLVPCKDGNIYVFNYVTGSSSSVFSWRDPAAFSNAVGHMSMPGPNQLLASNGLNKVLRWDRNAQGIWKKVPNDLELTHRIVTPLVPLSGNRVAVGDDAGNLHALALAALGTSKQWNVKGSITKGPFRVGADGVGCIVDNRKLWWITGPDDEEGKVYASADIASIIGEATQMGDDFLIAVLKRDAGLGMLASYLWIEIATGKLIHTERLPVGLAPSSGASALGKNRAFAPLSDGTVRILVKPDATTVANP